MKIFVVTADIQLINEPSWLQDFRRRYDDDYPYHVTLKLPTSIEDEQVPDIKQKLDNLLSTVQVPGHSVTLEFNKLVFGPDAPGGACIMIDAAGDEIIYNLQKKIVSALSDYKQYYKEKYKGYEEDFRPHITIARNLDQPSYERAKQDLLINYKCRGKVSKLILTVVDNFGPEEANDPERQTIYQL